MALLTRDKWIVCTIVINCFGAFAYRSYRSTHCGEIQRPGIVNLSREEAMGRQAAGSLAPGKFTLVEFGDYECPPCARAQSDLAALERKHRGKLRLVFRHYPLKTIHAHAFEAAVAAEAAREQGKFRQMHEALFGRRLSLGADEIQAIAQGLELDMLRFRKSCRSTARAAVDYDIAEADALSVKGTPTFFLCLPDGRVMRLGSLDQVEPFLQ